MSGISWRDLARELRKAPPELLASFRVKAGASDSELMRSVLDYVPELELAAGLNTKDLDADIDLWRNLRKDSSAAKVLSKKAEWAKRKFQVVDETFSFPVNEALRQAGAIGSEDTAGDAAGQAVGGGIRGAALNMGVRVLTDPTSWIPSPATASKALKGLSVAGNAMQGAEIIKVGREFGFTSPEFAAAVAGGVAARGVSRGVSTAADRAIRGRARVPTITPMVAPVAPSAVASGGTVHAPVKVATTPPPDPTPLARPNVVEPIEHIEPEAVVRSAMDEDLTGLDEVAPIKKQTPDMVFDEIYRQGAEADMARIANDLKGLPTEKQAHDVVLAIAERTGLEPRRIMKVLDGKGDSPEKQKVRQAIIDIDPFQSREQVDEFVKDGGNDALVEALPLPREAGEKKPRYGVGSKKVEVEFEDDLDKALYIIAQKKPSKHDGRYLAFVVSRTGMDEAQARAAGVAVRDRIKAAAEADPGKPLFIPIDEGMAHEGMAHGSVKKTPGAEPKADMADMAYIERHMADIERQRKARRPRTKAELADIEQQMQALDAKSGGLAAEMLRSKFSRGLARSLMGEASRRIPGVEKADVAEIMDLAKQHGGFNTPGFNAAVAERAKLREQAGATRAQKTPNGPMEPGAPNAPQGDAGASRLPDYKNKEFSLIGKGDGGAVRRFVGALFGGETHRGALDAKGMNATADTLDNLGDKTDARMKQAGNIKAELRMMNATNDDIELVRAFIEDGKLPAGEKQQARVKEMTNMIQGFQNETHKVARERDPAKAAEFVEKYFARTGTPKGAPKPVHGTDNIQRPLDQVGQSRAASLNKERTVKLGTEDSDRVSRPLDIDELFLDLDRRARNAAALEAGATMDRTPENYPKTWKLILDDQMAKASAFLGKDENGVKKKLSDGAAEKVREKAEETFGSLQLPDLIEAVAKDRPTANWENIVRNDDVVQAINAVVRGVDKMDPAYRKATDVATSASSFLQLGHAPFLNILGLQSTYPLAKDALKNKGHGEVVASTIAAWKTLKATLGAGKSLATDVAYHAGRPFGARLSPNQREFGTSGSTWNIPRRAVVAADRAARTGVADALEDLIPHMRPETLKFIDRSLPLTDPKNIQIVRREISALSQGSGNSANRLKADGSAMDVVRELGLQYTGPSARLFEKAAPRALESPIGTATAAILFGEISNTLRGISRGTGANVAGEETEDQKKGREFDPENPVESGKSVLKAIVSGDRSPHLGVRILQDIVPSIPFAQAALSNAAFGQGGGVGSKSIASIFPSLGALNQTVKGVEMAYDTGDIRALLSVVNGPGVGHEWLKVVAYEAARRKAASQHTLSATTGIGQVPQNSGWGFKLDQMMTGKITFEEAMKDLIVNTQPGTEGPSNAYRRKENAQAAQAAKRK